MDKLVKKQFSEDDIIIPQLKSNGTIYDPIIDNEKITISNIIKEEVKKQLKGYNIGCKKKKEK